MNNPVLADKEQRPTEAIIFSHIGAARGRWKKIFAHIHDSHPDFDSEWRFYKDGSRWLLKTTRKTKTIFWLSVVQGSFIITFYFGDKAESAILGSTISASLIDAFQDGKRYGKIRGISVRVENEAAVADVKALIEIKLRTK